MKIISSLEELTCKVFEKQSGHDGSSLFTVAISGIDASGKGYTSALLQQQLEQKGLKTALLNIDPWQNIIPVRLQKENPAKNFYEHAFRWNDFFDQLAVPLRCNKGIHLSVKGVYSHADECYDLDYHYDNKDILLIEGIFLFKKEFLSFYDYKIWINCSFSTGLQRAVKRNAEKLDEESLVSDYLTFYYPAQRYHFEIDNPAAAADIIFDNDL